MKIQRVKAIDKVEADRGKVALRYGPLVYNIEQVDQDIRKALSPAATLMTEWKPDLLGGVVVINGQFADGSPMRAIPNFARMNRYTVPPPAQKQSRSPASIVWIAEAGNSFVTRKINLPRNWDKLVAKYKNVVPSYAGY
jgi:hypothetical protein